MEATELYTGVGSTEAWKLDFGPDASGDFKFVQIVTAEAVGIISTKYVNRACVVTHSVTISTGGVRHIKKKRRRSSETNLAKGAFDLYDTDDHFFLDKLR
jgi:hypothetical protein